MQGTLLPLESRARAAFRKDCTVTIKRPVRPQPLAVSGEWPYRRAGETETWDGSVEIREPTGGERGVMGICEMDAPYGRPGDLIVVQEPFRLDNKYDGYTMDDLMEVAIKAPEDVCYTDTAEVITLDGRLREAEEMPRAFCRMQVRIWKVWVEREDDVWNWKTELKRTQ